MMMMNKNRLTRADSVNEQRRYWNRVWNKEVQDKLVSRGGIVLIKAGINIQNILYADQFQKNEMKVLPSREYKQK